MKLRKFQREFERAIENPAYDTVALSGPRGLSKSFLAARVLSRCMTPGDRLHQRGKTYVLGAGSLDQATNAFGFIREELEPRGGYRFLESSTRMGVTHVESKTKLRVMSSNAKTSFGLVNVPLLVLDEPGALEIVGGQLLADSIFTAQGKVGSKLKAVLIGTLAPMATDSGHWWYDLIKTGTRGKTWVRVFQGDRETWDTWPTIQKANPLVSLDAGFRAKLLEERDAAREDTRLKARFLSYRLNIPTRDESEMLLTVDDWERMAQRPVTDAEGLPIVGIDLGGGRAWSSAVAIWQTGRIEALAVAPGIPDLETQERRDRVGVGTYQRLAESGRLEVAEGLRVQPPSALWDLICRRWGQPQHVILDRFKLSELQDAVSPGVSFEARITRWSDSTFDIRALRRLVKDGPFNVSPESAPLLAFSLSKANVSNDSSGNSRLEKKGTSNTGRDDVAAALTLVGGAYARETGKMSGGYLGLV